MTTTLILVAAGVAGGFLAGLLGIGGGVIFAPTLLFTFRALGVPDEALVPLTTGSSLFCTMLTAGSGAWGHHKKGSLDRRTALYVGLSSAVFVYLVKHFVTTQPWYTPRVFSVAFAAVLLVVVYRMVRERPGGGGLHAGKPGIPKLTAIGAASGSLASAVGVGGGIILVPAFNKLLRFPMRLASGTSNATIVLTALAGTLVYALTVAPDLGKYAVGYVDFGRSLALALPAVVTARLGVHAAHRIETRYLRWTFAALGLVVAVRLIARSVG